MGSRRGGPRGTVEDEEDEEELESGARRRWPWPSPPLCSPLDPPARTLALRHPPPPPRTRSSDPARILNRPRRSCPAAAAALVLPPAPVPVPVPVLALAGAAAAAAAAPSAPGTPPFPSRLPVRSLEGKASSACGSVCVDVIWMRQSRGGGSCVLACDHRGASVCLVESLIGSLSRGWRRQKKRTTLTCTPVRFCLVLGSAF